MKDQCRKAYKAIFDVIDKYKDVIIFDVNELKEQAYLHLFGIELKEDYGLNINPRNIRSVDWNRFGEYMSIGWWGNKKRTISWPVDDRQPNDELLLRIVFPTGPFIFGDSTWPSKDYPVSFFQKFWLELKSYQPDYVDEVNRALFWKIQNAKSVFNAFNAILEKYHRLNQEDKKQRRIKKMEQELAKLKQK